MALSVPTYDPQKTAVSLATSDTENAQALIDAQSKAATATTTGLATLSSAMLAFDAVLAALSGKKSIVANTATFSSSVGTATAGVNATPGKYSFYVQQIATANQAAFNNLPDGMDVDGAGTITISAGDISFDIDLAAADASGDGKLSVKELAAAINASADNKDGVTASTLTIGGVTSLVLTSDKTGLDNAITVSAGGTDGFSTALADAANRQDLVTARNAIVWLGDKDTGTQIEQASNTFDVLDGVSMTFTAAQTGDTPVTLTVGSDKDGTTANVQSLVDGWNKLVAVLKTLTSHGDATAGTAPAVFASDSGVTALQTRMQAILRQSIGDTSLVAYGISAQRDGTLKLDATRLQKQLTANPTGLDALLGKVGSTTSSGVLGGLDKLMSQWTSSTSGQIATRRESNTRLQTSLADRQDRLTTQYNSAYARYLKQFTALQDLQSQLSSTTTLFDSLFGSSDD